MSFSQIQLIGNVGRDPELKVTSDGTPYTKFSLAVTKKTKDKETTTWYECTAWRGSAETIERHVTKGTALFVQGDLFVRQYTTRDGKQGFSLDVQVEKWTFAGSKRNGEISVSPSDDQASNGQANDALLPDWSEE